MLDKLLSQLALVITTVVTATSAHAVTGTHLDTQSFTEVESFLDETVGTHRRGRTLIVFDLDNTVLATDTDFGSEHWYMWQADLLKNGITEDTVASDVDGLLRVQGWLYTLGGSHPTEPAIPAALTALATRGARLMALTSRGGENRDATLRELRRHGFPFASAAPGPHGGYAGRYLPFDPSDPTRYGLDADDSQALALSPPKSVIFEDGVMLTAGQHKGAMLKTLLAKTGLHPDAIIFVDDRPHHLDGVRAAFATRPELVHTIRYHHEQPAIDTFNASDKAAVKAQWCRLSKGLPAATSAPLRPCP